MFKSLKLRIYLLAFGPFLLIAFVSALTQVQTLNTVNKDVSRLVAESTIETEKNRLVTVMDSAISMIQSEINKPGQEGMMTGLNMLNQYQFDGGDGYLYAYKTDGLRLLHGAGGELNINLYNLQDAYGNYLLQDIINAAVKGDGFSQYYFPKPGETEASKKYGYAVYIKKWDVVLGTGFYIDSADKIVADITAEVDEIQTTSQWFGLMVLAFFFGVLTLIVLLSSRSVLTPLITLGSAVKNLASGQGDLTKTLPNSSIDILNNIAQDFNVFLKSMAQDIGYLKQSSSSLLSISVTSNDQRKALTDASNRQISETDLVASAIEEMKANSNEIASHAESTKRSAENTELEIQEVLHQVQLSSKQLDELSSVLTTVEESINVLGGNVGEINVALGVIQGISEQTNLLALNAAIEAARAGEQGRGFAVVADEVRGLAQRSQNSTVEIKDILEKLQVSAVKATEDMQGSLERRERVLNAMSKISEIINSSTESIKNLTQMNVQVSTAAHQQSDVASDIAQNVVGIAELAKDIGQDADKTATQMQLLEEQAQVIKSISDKFKV
ncbi:methyl-accepting chemotaxis protein [Marinomonas sp. A79]|uniref:Methyl-accepting chemotaxis protein n=1 Tax=Marinomonas vulgaris TaxID=2823372 RepID=A0ABS5HE72_9GAMM|nr:methyl-accepting chemotaxis protein [Marinomonas vulgaris]MBR7889785.1 methyl-accepting chemotaxis protein [Marinomonas vulgaris]